MTIVSRFHFASLVAVLTMVMGVTAAGSASLFLHVDNQGLFGRAGYFDFRYFYRGGLPLTRFSTQTLRFECLTTCTSHSCALAGSVNVTGSYCIQWSVEEIGSGLESSGTCQCILRGARYCLAYTCDQSVTKTSTFCSDDTCYLSTSTFGKTKSCTCDTSGAANSPDYCHDWTCLGFGDGPVKTAYWHCERPVSQIPEMSGVFSKDFCWLFYSDQYSDAVAETNDCQCDTFSEDRQFCLEWMCYQRISKNWIWYSSLIASCVGALLNLWVPYAVVAAADDLAALGLGAWALVTYLPIVLVGGIPSLIANTGALAAAVLYVNRTRLVSSCQREPISVELEGVSICPACGKPWAKGAPGSVI